MFDISGWEFLTLAVLAVLIFGPERLPKVAADAGRFLRGVKEYVQGAKSDLQRELGPAFADMKVGDFTPRGLLRKTLGEDSDVLDDLRGHVDLRKDLRDLDPREGYGSSMVREHTARPLAPNERPPFDRDAT